MAERSSDVDYCGVTVTKGREKQEIVKRKYPEQQIKSEKIADSKSPILRIKTDLQSGL